MTAGSFETEAWIGRLSKSLVDLKKAQVAFSRVCRQRGARRVGTPSGRGKEESVSLDDLRVFYSRVRYGLGLEQGPEREQVRDALNATRYVLLSHPQLERVAVSGRTIGENDFWLRVLNSGSSISASDLVAGLVTRASEVPVDGFRVAATEMNAFLRPVEDDVAGVLAGLDEGCDALLFYGLTVRNRLNVEEGVSVLPYSEVRRFVGEDVLEELAPTAALHNWGPIGAIVSTYCWRPTFSQRGRLDETLRRPRTQLFEDGKVLLDLLSVSHKAPLVPLAAISHCVDERAARLFGQAKHGPGLYRAYSSEASGHLIEQIELVPERFNEACELFRSRRTRNYRKMSRFVGLLAKALKRSTYNDQILDVAIALEGMYEPPNHNIARELARRVSGFLGPGLEDQERIKEIIHSFYKTRSHVVHGDRGETKLLSKGASFVRGFDLAQKSLFKFVREGAPNNW